jgi:hypothetical protein
MVRISKNILNKINLTIKSRNSRLFYIKNFKNESEEINYVNKTW